MDENRCKVCTNKLSHIASDRGLWYWCDGCGSLARKIDGRMGEPQSPGTFFALLAMRSPTTTDSERKSERFVITLRPEQMQALTQGNVVEECLRGRHQDSVVLIQCEE